MIPALHIALVFATLGYLWRYTRGRSALSLVREPPRGSDTSAIVGALSALEHELIKHRVPVLRSLLAKRTWSSDDWALLARTIGRGEASFAAELGEYLDAVQRGAGHSYVNFAGDPAFGRVVAHVRAIQRTAESWLAEGAQGTPPESEREALETRCEWLAGTFRRYLVELTRGAFQVEITKTLLERTARAGLAEGGKRGGTVEVEPPEYSAVARVSRSDLDLILRNLVRNAAQAAPSERPGVLVRVRAEMDEIGEESLLLEVHDQSPEPLDTDAVFSREAKRGLGIVSAALRRNGAGLSTCTSKVEGFEKAVVVRFDRSADRRKPEHLAIGEPSRRQRWVLAGLTLLNVLGAAGHFAYASAVSVSDERLSIETPGNDCLVEPMSSADTVLACLTARGEPEGGGRAVVFASATSEPLPSFSVEADPCVRVRRDTHNLRLDATTCAARPDAAARARVVASAWWARRDREWRVLFW